MAIYLNLHFPEPQILRENFEKNESMHHLDLQKEGLAKLITDVAVARFSNQTFLLNDFRIILSSMLSDLTRGTDGSAHLLLGDMKISFPVNQFKDLKGIILSIFKGCVKYDYYVVTN